MTGEAGERDGRIDCRQCPLLGCEGLRPLDADELDYMNGFKQGELSLDRGTSVIEQGAQSPHIFTVLDGILMRYRTLEDGRRQIVNFMFPGDLIGLQSAVHEPASHSVEAVSAARLCVFPRDGFVDLIADKPALGYDVVWLAAREERALEEHIISLGQRDAQEKVVSLAVFLLQRAKDTGLADDSNRLRVRITQGQIADMLGLSVVHTNRTMQSLRSSDIIRWTQDEIVVPDMDAAREFSASLELAHVPRPFL